MPDGTVDIFLESSFFSVVSGTELITTPFTAGEPDNIGQRDISTDYLALPGISGSLEIYADVFVTSSGSLKTDGYFNTAVGYETQTSGLGMAVALIDYAVPATISGLKRTHDIDLAYYTGLTKISGTIDARLKFTGGAAYAYSDNILGSYRARADETETYIYEADYTAGGEYNPNSPATPEEQVIISGTFNFDQLIELGQLSVDGTQQQVCDIFFAGYPMEFHPDKYTYRFHTLTGDEGDTQGPEWEVKVIPGAVRDLLFDLYSSAEETNYYHSNVVCGHTSFSGIDFPTDLVSYSFESETISGTISHYGWSSICSISGTNGYAFDIDLLSLKISNFSLDIDDHTVASGNVCVDITDDIHTVVPSLSYFLVDGVVASGTFTPINDGYMMCYNPTDDFASFLGSTTFTVHAANDNGDILEEAFYLTSGYIVEYDNITQDYGMGSQVVVMASAENLSSCPSTGADAYFFTTVKKVEYNLGATIVGQPWSEKNLSAEIVPTTDTIYFYGKTFRIEIRAKDFAGNVMEPFTFEFKIEDEPE